MTPHPGRISLNCRPLCLPFSCAQQNNKLYCPYQVAGKARNKELIHIAEIVSFGKPAFAGKFPANMTFIQLQPWMPELLRFGLQPFTFRTDGYSSVHDGDIPFIFVVGHPDLSNLKELVDRAEEQYRIRLKSYPDNLSWEETILMLERDNVCVRLRGRGIDDLIQKWAWEIWIDHGSDQPADIDLMRAIDKLFTDITEEIAAGL